jgi:hypothetical protein
MTRGQSSLKPSKLQPITRSQFLCEIDFEVGEVNGAAHTAAHTKDGATGQRIVVSSRTWHWIDAFAGAAEADWLALS